MIIIIVINSISTFTIQKRSYAQQVESKLKDISLFLTDIIESDGQNFLYMQDYLIKHIPQLKIPIDFNGDHRQDLIKFNRKFVNIYPGKVFSIDISFDEMPDDMKFLYTEFMFKRWLNIFEKAKDKFNIKYAYYLVPTGEELHMYYFFNFYRGPSKYHGPNFINICPDVYEPRNEHKKMWEAWETGVSPQGYDRYDNQFGKTYAYYTPLIINDRKCGVICVEFETDKISSDILSNVLKQIIYMSLVVILSHILIMYIIYKKSLVKIENLNKAINLYSSSKNVDIAQNIEKNISGNDELSYLAKSFSSLIYEIHNYLSYLQRLSSELYKTKNALDSERERALVFEELSVKDSLTGVKNKNAYDISVKKLERKIAEGKANFALAVIDLNSLKYINDQYGHERGNFIIKKLSSLVCAIFAHSPVYRIGGDEFVILLENNDLRNINTLLKEFTDTIDKLSSDEQLNPWERVSAAIGVAHYDPKLDKNVKSIFNRADKEMYAMKKKMKLQNQCYARQ